jgi:hypothetical protein
MSVPKILLLLLLRQIHLKALIVEIDELVEIRCGTVVEVWGSRRKSAQNGPLDAIEVAAQSRNERFAGVARVERLWLVGVERIGAAADEIYGQIGHRQLGQAARDVGVGLEARQHRVTRADVERQRERVIPDVGCIVTGRARARECARLAERCVVVEAAHV